MIDELAAVETHRQGDRMAELAGLLRMGGQWEQRSGVLTLSVETPYACVARHLSRLVSSLFDVPVRTVSIPPVAGRKAAQFSVHMGSGSAEMVRRLGLITRSGEPVRGLPLMIINGPISVIDAALRGAVLARGSLSDPARSSALEVECPETVAGQALVGCVRRLGLTARMRETRGEERFAVRDAEGIVVLLNRMGAYRTCLRWDEARRAQQAQTTTSRLVNFDDANLRRSARAAVAAAARVERAMAILADDVPEHLAEAGQLRVRFKQASLEELGRLAEPAMTKDAIAGRIRRLLSMADRRAEELGIEGTAAAVTDDLLDPE
ncbi:DNA-binding protein WhiA [Corynebacterium uberis]|uniref:DNA-binding protein WhiA n=1 Tax=Corynebacterium TaxID=1716 RepID=UPI001D0B8FE5|nr:MULTISPECIES: DNA-binding protein WhiA [Corynebacterium]MCZ9308597.1 DNA-binding protein WhiA [Corynebacterium sp. c6VSa_13]UDL74704.1 DNA-binding protein WhiA [Corynebacterium uberis]UDL76950.1 DNA-binding protein WhiA [Corynebacterium uberis]UDL79161.1 DNA-binding protein WhiA [Corynebacterium uberis]UDL81366.1 DNA-binding protein WhiA [Corynebacterium uberis]